ncbi:MAG: hypothetical protein Q9221_005430 [Calogaya cf. arnoldii]
MAPAPPKRVTLSTKTKPSTDLGKSPPKTTKKSKKSDALSRPYRNDSHVQDGSESSDSQQGKPTQQANSSPARIRRNNNLQRPVCNRPGPGTPEFWEVGDALTSGAQINGKKAVSRLHVVTNKKTGEVRVQDIPIPLYTSDSEEDTKSLFTGETVPTFRQKTVQELYHDIQENPDIRFDRKAIEQLLANTHPETLEEITQYYHDLRSAAWKWAKDTFQYASSTPLDLMHLATTHPELMEYINSTSASPQLVDWETFLAKKRAAIVYAILGKVIDVHVFGEELFGAGPEQKHTLRASDRKTMDHDGFLRQKTRSSTLTALLPRPESLPPHLLPNIQTLQGQLLTLFSPLLPHPINNQTPNTNHPLFALLLSAATLSISIRRNKHEICYFTPSPPPGSAYEKQEMAALNSADMGIALGVKGVEEMVGKGGIVYKVGVAGWPGCVAHWPGERLKTKGRKKEMEQGVRTQVVAKADVWVVMEAVDSSADRLGIGIGKEKGRKTLRAEMWDRSLYAGYEKRIRRLRMRRRVGIAAAVMAVGGYYFGGDTLRQVGDFMKGAIRLEGKGWEDVVVRRRRIWVEGYQKAFDGFKGSFQ